MAAATGQGVLPELGQVPWRARTDERYLRRNARVWTTWTLAYGIPFPAAAVGLMLLEPLAFPVALACLAHGWIIPELYAFRGASVLRPKGPPRNLPELGQNPLAGRGRHAVLLAAGYGAPEDHQSGVARKLTQLLGLSAALVVHRDVALVEPGAKLLHRRVERGLVGGRPLGQGRVARAVHPDQS